MSCGEELQWCREELLKTKQTVAALTKFADVGREMVRITTTVRGEDEWGAIPKLWEMCLDERDALTEQVAALTKENERLQTIDLDSQMAVQKLAASNAREQKLRDVLQEYTNASYRDDSIADRAADALALPTDDTALQALLQQEREKVASKFQAMVGGYDIAATIRSMT